MRSLPRLALTSLVATLVLVAVGGFTRGSDSGYGCADRWPLCENGLAGGWLPRAEYHMIIEWSHRWLAASVGLLAVATAVVALRYHRTQRGVVVPAVSAVVVIGIQAWVGRLVVKEGLDADLVSVHLAISMTVVALLTVVVVAGGALSGAVTGADRAVTQDRAWTTKLAVAAGGSIVLLLLGTYVHNLHISGWPLVGGKFFPGLSNRFIAVHYFHRVVAGSGAVYLVYLSMNLSRWRRPAVERRLVHTATAVYLVNVGLGAAHVFTKVEQSLLVAAHLAAAAVVWSTLVAATTLAALRRPIAVTALGTGPKPPSSVGSWEPGPFETPTVTSWSSRTS